MNFLGFINRIKNAKKFGLRKLTTNSNGGGGGGESRGSIGGEEENSTTNSIIACENSTKDSLRQREMTSNSGSERERSPGRQEEYPDVPSSALEDELQDSDECSDDSDQEDDEDYRKGS